jgi:hypothetical protein
MLTSLALAAALAAQPSQAATAVKPISVVVEAPAGAPAEVQAWAAELRTALAARKDEFRAPKAGEKPELVVRLGSAGPADAGRTVLSWEVVRAGQTKPFSYTYSGAVRPQAEKLARNLRGLTDPMLAAAPAPKK